MDLPIYKLLVEKGHSADQKVIDLLFLTSKDKLWALALASKKWSIMRESGVDSP